MSELWYSHLEIPAPNGYKIILKDFTFISKNIWKELHICIPIFFPFVCVYCPLSVTNTYHRSCEKEKAERGVCEGGLKAAAVKLNTPNPPNHQLLEKLFSYKPLLCRFKLMKEHKIYRVSTKMVHVGKYFSFIASICIQNLCSILSTICFR